MKTYLSLFLLMVATLAGAQVTTFPSNVVVNSKVGIGNSAPLATLSVSNNTATFPLFQLFNSNNPVASVTVASNGYVGIGTSDPLFPLDVRGPAGISGESVGATVGLFYDFVVQNNLLIQDGAGVAGQVLTSIDGVGTAKWAAPSAGSVAAPVSSVQFNSNGFLRGSAGFVINPEAIYNGTGYAISGSPRVKIGTNSESMLGIEDNSALLIARFVNGSNLFSHAVRDETRFQSTNSSAYASYDSIFTMMMVGGVTNNHANSYQSRYYVGGTGTLGVAYAHSSQLITTNLVQNYLPFYVATPLLYTNSTSTGSVAFASALYMEPFPASIPSYLFYSPGPSAAYMAGSLQVGGNGVFGGNLSSLELYSYSDFNSVKTGAGGPAKANIGFYNTLDGHNIAPNLTSTSQKNTYLGANVGVLQTNNFGNVFSGAFSGHDATGHSNVFAGQYSGYYESGNNKLIVDTFSRPNEAEGRVKALLYGVGSITTAAQTLTVNGSLGINTLAPSAALDVPGEARIGILIATNATFTNLSVTTLNVNNLNVTNASGLTQVVAMAMGTATVTNSLTAGIISGTIISASTSVSLANNTPLTWTSAARIRSATDGVLLFQNGAQSDYTRSQLGGTTAAFPAIGRTNGHTSIIGADGAVDGTSTNGIWLMGGPIIQDFTLGAPAAPTRQGAVFWNDGTNLCAVFRNGAGTLSTNKFTMASWP